MYKAFCCGEVLIVSSVIAAAVVKTSEIMWFWRLGADALKQLGALSKHWKPHRTAPDLSEIGLICCSLNNTKLLLENSERALTNTDSSNIMMVLNQSHLTQTRRRRLSYIRSSSLWSYGYYSRFFLYVMRVQRDPDRNVRMWKWTWLKRADSSHVRTPRDLAHLHKHLKADIMHLYFNSCDITKQSRSLTSVYGLLEKFKPADFLAEV